MTTSGRAVRWAGAAAVLALAVGCGSEAKLYRVSGTVTYNGKPIPAGIIYFDPDPTKGGTGTQGSADIKDGKFDTALGGQGVKGGAYVVRIMGFDGKPGNEAPLGRALWDGPEYEEKRDFPAQDTEVTINIPARKK